MVSVSISVTQLESTSTIQNLLVKKDNDALVKDLIYQLKVADSFDYEKVKSIIEVLESRYVPIQTTSFLAFALEGNWKHLYSNFPLPRKDPSL